ncbi:hypothetical protein Tco_0990160 [Tanacetum coccineum]|uniref:Uncharacterized protein n=1 Tax=Tanacetum coccineum TaxID=301880 RepID=A0ABQ5EVN8_9ASTR
MVAYLEKSEGSERFLLGMIVNRFKSGSYRVNSVMKSIISHEDASDNGTASNKPKQQQQQLIPTTTTISNIKLPILKKEEYDIWAMEMEHYLEYIDNDVWKVIQNGNSKKRISTGKDVIYLSSFAKQSKDLDLLHEDLEQIDDMDIEEMGINPVQLNTVRQNVNSVRPNVNTGRANVNSVRQNGTAVKTSASYNWRKTRPNSNCNSGSNFVQSVNAKGPQGRPKPEKLGGGEGGRGKASVCGYLAHELGKHGCIFFKEIKGGICSTIGGIKDAQTRFETTSKQSNDPPLSRVNTLGSGEDNMKLMELMAHCTILSELNSYLNSYLRDILGKDMHYPFTRL